MVDAVKRSVLEQRRRFPHGRESEDIHHIANGQWAILLREHAQPLLAVLQEQRLARLLVSDHSLIPVAMLRALSRRKTHERREGHHLRLHFDPNEPEIRNVKQHPDQLSVGIEQAAANAIDQYFAVDPGRKVLFLGDWSSYIEGTAAGGHGHRQDGFRPRSVVDRNRAHNPADLRPLAVLLAAAKFAETVRPRARQGPFAHHARALFANDRRELSRSGDSFQLDHITPVVRNLGSQTTLDVNASGRVLHEEVGRWYVVRDDPSDLDRIAQSCFFGTETPDLIRVS